MHLSWNARLDHKHLPCERSWSVHDGGHEYFEVGFCIFFFNVVRPVIAANPLPASLLSNDAFGVCVKLRVAGAAERNLQAVFTAKRLWNSVVPV